MKSLPFALLVLLLAITTLRGAENPAPVRFTAYIGGFLGGSYRVELHEDRLTYTESRGASVTQRGTITPTAAQWREFRQTLDELKIWQWQPNYPSRGVEDGTQWSLDLAYADLALKTRGDNNYPEASGKPNHKPQPTETFGRYLAAVEKLLGGKRFH